MPSQCRSRQLFRTNCGGGQSWLEFLHSGQAGGKVGQTIVVCQAAVPLAKHDRVEIPPRTSGNPLCLARFFMKFRGRNAHSNRPRKAMGCPTKRAGFQSASSGVKTRASLEKPPERRRRGLRSVPSFALRD